MAHGLGQGIIDSIPRLFASGRAVSDAERPHEGGEAVKERRRAERAPDRLGSP
jgi:hypothetical protein